ncbi:DUF1553 domain-containing protein [bacterium]|nr:DUF1553 domain-containing protein [bacterium]
MASSTAHADDAIQLGRRAVIACLIIATGVMVFSACPVIADEVEFSRDVLPLLQKHCLDCHGPDTAESHLRLDSPVAALRGGDSGEQAIVPGKSDQSYLLTRVLHADAKQRMPPDAEPLSREEIAILKVWIDQTSHWETAKQELKDRRLDHWSFQPLLRPAVPGTATHPIDAFIEQRLAQNQLTLSPSASRSTLIRRLSLVMLGLPPSPDRVAEFVADDSPQAWDRLVEEMLASPHYGERMATPWLDLVRFGETHGFETNRERPHAWRYRDWVVQAFNADQPYDQFVRDQIAGDAWGADAATGFLVAGSYDLVKGQDELLRLTQRQDELADIINATGTAFLGLTLGCARCHNHKFDPVTQTDYYALQAVFAGVNHADRALPMPAETQQQLERLDEQLAQLRQQLMPYLAENRDPATRKRPAVQAKENIERITPTETRIVRITIQKTNQSQPCIDEFQIFAAGKNVALASAGAKATSSGDFVHPLHKLEHINDGRFGNARSWIANDVTGGWVQIEFAQPETIDLILWGRDREGRYADRLAIDYRIECSPDGQTWELLATSADREPFATDQPSTPKYDFAGLSQQEQQRGQQWLERLEQLTATRDQLAQPILVYAGTFSQPDPIHRLYRGEPTAPREVVTPAGIAALTSLTMPADLPERERRVALADWIANKKNPLTARVMANRIWQFHFGTGLVDTPSDFGANGTRPSHPELLDWLASELIDSGWSLKHLHRLILSSQTWQQASHPRPDGVKIDAGTRLLWRFPPRRLEAEAIRDSQLAISGVLDLSVGGPGFSAFEVEAENVRHYHPKTHFESTDFRRMLYMTKVRQERDAVFGLFDCPDNTQVVPKRSRSTTPLQALNLLNSPFTLQVADLFAQRLQREANTQPEQIQWAYELCFGRSASADEVAQATDFITATDLQQFARAMLNANELVFLP